MVSEIATSAAATAMDGRCMGTIIIKRTARATFYAR
jgi:hypothetical protein